MFLIISSTISTLKFWFSLANGSRHRKVKKEDVKIDIKCSWNFKFNVNHFVSLRRTDTQKSSVSPQTLMHKCEIILIHIKYRHLEPGQYSVYFLNSITGNWQFLYLHYKTCVMCEAYWENLWQLAQNNIIWRRKTTRVTFRVVKPSIYIYVDAKLV